MFMRTWVLILLMSTSTHCTKMTSLPHWKFGLYLLQSMWWMTCTKTSSDCFMLTLDCASHPSCGWFCWSCCSGIWPSLPVVGQLCWTHQLSLLSLASGQCHYAVRFCVRIVHCSHHSQQHWQQDTLCGIVSSLTLLHWLSRMCSCSWVTCWSTLNLCGKCANEITSLYSIRCLISSFVTIQLCRMYSCKGATNTHEFWIVACMCACTVCSLDKPPWLAIPFSTVVAIAAGLLLIPIAGLFAFHIYLVLIGQTTNEKVSRFSQVFSALLPVTHSSLGLGDELVCRADLVSAHTDSSEPVHHPSGQTLPKTKF